MNARKELAPSCLQRCTGCGGWSGVGWGAAAGVHTAVSKHALQSHPCADSPARRQAPGQKLGPRSVRSGLCVCTWRASAVGCVIHSRIWLAQPLLASVSSFTSGPLRTAPLSCKPLLWTLLCLLPVHQARTLLVVFQRGRQIWSQGASRAAAGDEVRAAAQAADGSEGFGSCRVARLHGSNR